MTHLRMEITWAVLGDDRRSPSSGSILVNRFQRCSTYTLLITLAVLAATLFHLRYQFNRDRTAVANLGPTHHFAPVDEPVFVSLGPHVIGYYTWTGPALLESPMRRARIPWFDRVTRIHILDDSHVSEEALAALAALPRLSQVCVDDATIPRKVYNDVVGGPTGGVNFAFIDN